MNAHRLVAIAALAGFSCMAAELTAVRVLAPNFGDSAPVWTNVIGVILVAMALGAVLGGRIAGQATAPARAVLILLLGAAWLTLAAFLAPWLGGYLVPHHLPLDHAMPTLVAGSLAASALLFAPPMMMIGALTPVLVSELAQTQPVGRAAGLLSAAGTIGSLMGTFLATHWLVPQFGCRVALLVAASALALGAALQGRCRWLVPTSGALLAMGWWLPSPLRALPPGERLLQERESRYQYLQMVRDERAAPARTVLRINEGLDSFHSVAVDGSQLTGGAYYDWHVLAPWLAYGAHLPQPLQVLSLGDAAGSLVRVYGGVLPGAVVDRVDLDAATMEMGEKWFPPCRVAGQTFALDGRVFLAHAERCWHVIHVDAYAHQVYVPTHLSSREFFAAAHARLHPQGVITCNVGALHLQDPVLQAIAGTLRAVFGNASAIQVKNSRNVLLCAVRDGRIDPQRLPEQPQTALHAADAAQLTALLTYARQAQVWRDVGEGQPVLHDDQLQLDALLEASYLHSEDPSAVVPCVGTRQVADAELAAYQAANAADWGQVLAAVASSRAPSTYLREQAAAARWRLRHLHAADAEYRAALAAEPDAQVRARLQQQQADLQLDLQAQTDASVTKDRNRWLAALAVAAVLLGYLLVLVRGYRECQHCRR